jgi:hypothetical protein
MSENTTTTPVSEVAQSSESSNESVASTQSLNAQVDVAPSQAKPQSTELTKDVAVVKPEPKVEPTPEQMASKLDYTGLISKHVEEGGLSDEEFQALEDAGLSKSQFVMLAEAQKTIMLNNNNTLYNFVGGKENYESLKSFAAEHLSEDDIQGYNAAMASGNMKIAEIAVLGLNAMAERVRGKAPSIRLSADGIPAGNELAYSSQQELITDLNSKKYRTDSNFKASVDARRAKSGF